MLSSITFLVFTDMVEGSSDYNDQAPSVFRVVKLRGVGTKICVCNVCIYIVHDVFIWKVAL